MAALPLASAALAAHTIRRVPTGSHPERDGGGLHTQPPLRPLIVPAAALFTLWANIGLFRALWSPIFTSDRFSYYLSPFVLAAALSLVAFGFALFFGKSMLYENHQQVCRLVLPFACLAYAILSLGGAVAVEAAYTANFVGIIITQLAFWTASGKAARSRGDRASQAPFALMFGAMLAGGATGVGAGLSVLPVVGYDELFRYAPLIMTVLVSTLVVLDARGDRAQERRAAARAETPARFSEVIDEEVDRLGAQCKLTRREREVLGLLLAGRSRPFIRDDLGISLSTVNSHVKHIYGKAKVHSYQELLDLARRP